MNEKYTIMSPFDITSKILGPYLFSHTSRATLGDKMELYFQDHSFVPLFIQVVLFVDICAFSLSPACRRIISNPNHRGYAIYPDRIRF